MPNEQRNEVEIELLGQTRTLRATFGAIRAIESQLKTNLVPLIVKYTRGDFGLADTACIIFNGLRAADEKSPSLEEVGEAILQEGLDSASVATVEFLSLTMKGVGLGKSRGKAKS